MSQKFFGNNKIPTGSTVHPRGRWLAELWFSYPPPITPLGRPQWDYVDQTVFFPILYPQNHCYIPKFLTFLPLAHPSVTLKMWQQVSEIFANRMLNQPLVSICIKPKEWSHMTLIDSILLHTCFWFSHHT